MKFVRFREKVGLPPQYGVLEGENIHAISDSPLQVWSYTDAVYTLGDVRLLAPIQPAHIIGIGKNFIGPTEPIPEPPELPIFFFKPVTTVVGPNEPIVVPEGNEEVKYESELAVVIGRTGRNIPESDVFDYVFGYTVANDVAATNYFHPDGHWTIGKAFDTFCPLGPCMVNELDLGAVRVQAIHNGTLSQDAPLSLMITSIARMLAYISTFMTLQPGDVILTGTPAGASMVKRGDTIECRIEGIGSLRNPVA